MRVAILGGGVMGEAILASLLRTGADAAAQVTVADISSDRLRALRERYAVAVIEDNIEAIEHADAIVVAVKPQDAFDLCRSLRGYLGSNQLVVSIMAGVRLARLSEALDHGAVVRSMPNTPGRIGEGITVWTATASVTDQQLEQARTILKGFGKEIFVADEKFLDMATAVSGSGPAFVYLFVEAYVDAAVQVGFPRAVAQDLVIETIQGTIAYLRGSGKHPAELRNEVTSPAGTTAAGLYQLERAGLRAAVHDAVIAAHERSKELGK